MSNLSMSIKPLALSIALLAAFSGNAMAQSVQVLNSGSSSLNTSQPGVDDGYKKMNEELNDLTHQRKKLEAEAIVEELRARKLKAEKEREQIESGAVKDPRTGMLIKPGEEPEKKKAKKKDIFDQIYLTKVYSFDGSSSATVFFDGAIIQNMRVGDELTDGVRLADISRNSAVFAKGNERRRILITTEMKAYESAFRSEQQEGLMERPSAIRGVPIGADPMMGGMGGF